MSDTVGFVLSLPHQLVEAFKSTLETVATADRRSEIEPGDKAAAKLVREAVDLLDTGQARVAEVVAGRVVVHSWLKQAILLLFRLSKMKTIELGPFEYADKVPLKSGFKKLGVRVGPGASARYGSFLERGVVLMPSYVNIGAHVGHNTMVDTWATVGSRAQIGANVHLSGGAGIGGVLEPPQAAPVIVEDDCLIGSRCIVAEGARVGRGSVLGAGCILTGSIPVIDAQTGPRSDGSAPGARAAPARLRLGRGGSGATSLRDALHPRGSSTSTRANGTTSPSSSRSARPRRDGVSGARVADLLNLTADLVGIPSESHDEGAITERIRGELEATPWLRVDQLGNNVVARTDRGQTAFRLVIAGHTDTVPINGNGEPKIDGDTLWGCGASDMKSGIAVMLELARTVSDPSVDVTYVFYEAEEVDAVHNGLGRLFRERPDRRRVMSRSSVSQPTG